MSKPSWRYLVLDGSSRPVCDGNTGCRTFSSKKQAMAVAKEHVRIHQFETVSVYKLIADFEYPEPLQPKLTITKYE